MTQVIEFPDRTLIISDQRYIDALRGMCEAVIERIQDQDDWLDWLGEWRGRRG